MIGVVAELLVPAALIVGALAFVWFLVRLVRDGMRPAGSATELGVFVGSTVYFAYAGSVRHGEVVALGPGPRYVTVQQDGGELHRVLSEDVTIDPSSLQ